MAAPDSITLHNLSGTYVMNKTLSNDPDKVLTLQGIGWLVRQAVKYSSVTIKVKEYEEDRVTHIDIDQTTTGGITSHEARTLDGNMREVTDRIFGDVRGYSKFVNITEVQQPFLKEGWDQKSLGADNGELIGAYIESVGLDGDQWIAHQIWGFEIVDGARR